MMNYSILMIIDSLGSGGAQRQFVTLAKGLAARGHAVEVVTYHDEPFFEPDLTSAGIAIHRISKVGFAPLAIIRSMRRLVAQRHYDIAISFLRAASYYASLALFMTPVRLIVSDRISYDYSCKKYGTIFLQNLFILADFITTNSQCHLDEMQRFMPWVKSKSRVIFNGYAVNDFEESCLDALSLEQERLNLVVVASCQPHKNSITLAKALKILDQNKIPVSITWIGNTAANPRVVDAVDHTNRILIGGGIDRYWTWLGERRDVTKLLTFFDAMVHPSLMEGMSNSVCEALCAGLPVLLGNIADHPMLVDQARNGFLFSPDSPESIASAIADFYRLSPAARRGMSRNAKLFSKKFLDNSILVSRYDALIHEIMK